MSAAVIIPTYQESETVGPLLDELLQVDDLLVVVVDDSCDETTAQALYRYSNNIRVVLLRRQRGRGRSDAIRYGVNWILASKPQVDLIAEIDADSSHSVADLCRLMQFSGKADIIIGSRYVKGAKVEHWPFARLVFSKSANFLLRWLTKVPLHDVTGGFRCYSRDAASTLAGSVFRSKGFFGNSEAACLLSERGFRFLEVPIVFKNRRRGYSKFDTHEILSALGGLGYLVLRCSCAVVRKFSIRGQIVSDLRN